MKRIGIATCTIAATLAACASIVSKSDYPVIVGSNPPEADVVITNSRGIEVFRGRTPATVILPASDGFFSGASYQVSTRKDGHTAGAGAISSRIDGWYFANILFGGLIGMLIVDPATGAMYRLPDHVVMNLVPIPAPEATAEGGVLHVWSVEDLPAHHRRELLRRDAENREPLTKL